MGKTRRQVVLKEMMRTERELGVVIELPPWSPQLIHTETRLVHCHLLLVSPYRHAYGIPVGADENSTLTFYLYYQVPFWVFSLLSSNR